jgi:pyruvate,water dikinase
MKMKSSVTLSEQLVFTPQALKRSDVTLLEVGGKAWNLFRLYEYGFRVPAWCVVSSKVFNDLLEPIRNEIRSLLSRIDFKNQSSIQRASLTIAARICERDIPQEVQDEVRSSAAVITDGGSPVSVRSSIVGEDSSDDSFAGQMDSLLNVQPEHLFHTIVRVWASAFSARALVYRHHKGLSLHEISAAVIIQRMIHSVSSGVVFSRDPERNAKEIVISAGFGLGEGIVSNSVATDTYRISWESNSIHKEIARKDQRIVCSGHGGTRKEAVPEHIGSHQVLSDHQIRQLRDLACVVEECFGAPQDIEWAYDQQGTLFVLQARPIVFAKKSTASSVRIWDNSNIVESYPGITLPLTFSFIKRGYENAFRTAALGFLIIKRELKNNLTIFNNMIGLLNGRVYYNLLNWYTMLSYLPGFNRHKESWDQMIGISHKIEFPQSTLSFINRFAAVVIALWKLLTGKWNAIAFFKTFRSAYAKYKDLDFSCSSEDELITVYETLDRDVSGKWHLTLYNDFCAMKYYDWLTKLCTHWGLENYANLHHHLLCGETGVESVAPVHSLLTIAERVRSNTAFQTLFSNFDDRAIWETIQQNQNFQILKEMLNEYLTRFGDRGLEELKLEKPTFRDEPAALIGLLKSYIASHLSVRGMEMQEQEIRQSADAFVRQQLKNPVKRLLFGFVLNNARRAIAYRENMRFARSRLYGIVRRIFQRMSELFVEQRILDETADIYYLTIDEIFGIVQGTAVTHNLRSLVQIRKAEYDQFTKHSLQERIETTGIPCLNLLRNVQHDVQRGQKLKGIGCSSGVVEGRAKIVLDPKNVDDCTGSILVARSTDPGWVFLMISAKGIIVEKGSVLSHSAIIGRELGIPTIIAVNNATQLIPHGARVWMNASTGEVRWE